MKKDEFLIICQEFGCDINKILYNEEENIYGYNIPDIGFLTYYADYFYVTLKTDISPKIFDVDYENLNLMKVTYQDNEYLYHIYQKDFLKVLIKRFMEYKMLSSNIKRTQA